MGQTQTNIQVLDYTLHLTAAREEWRVEGSFRAMETCKPIIVAAPWFGTHLTFFLPDGADTMSSDLKKCLLCWIESKEHRTSVILRQQSGGIYGGLPRPSAMLGGIGIGSTFS